MGEALAILAAVLFALGTVQQKGLVEQGERAYARWGRLAVFFTPAIVSGTANMKHAQFVLWNLLASLGFAVSVAASADGLGRIFTGHDSAKDIATLVVGLAVGALVAVLSVRHHRHRSAAEGTPG